MVSEDNAVLCAEFSQSRNDMHWKLFDMKDGFIRWTGYDDNNWWDNVSTATAFRQRIGAVTGRRYLLDPATNEVAIATPQTPGSDHG